MPCGGINPGIICSTPSPASVAKDAFSALVDALTKGFGKAVELSLSFWTHVGTPTLSSTSGPVGNLRGATAWLTASVAVAALLAAAGRLALQRTSEPAVDAARGLVTLVVVAGVGVPAVAALTVAGDSFSTWILDRAGNGALGARLAAIAGATGSLGVGLAFIFAILGILASFAQACLMLIRVGVLVMLLGALPLFAAGSGTRTGRATFQRAIAWLLAFVCYKPAAAFVYASAFWLVGAGTNGVQVLSGLALMILAILAMPALLKLLTPAVAAAASGGGGAGTMAAGMVIATGARSISSRGGGSTPPPSTAGPSGATSTGTASAAGAAAPYVGLAAQGAGAAKQAAQSAAETTTSSNGKGEQ